MSNAAVINATNASGLTAGSPFTIDAGGDVVLKAFGSGSGAWSATLAFAPYVNGAIGSPITLSISSENPSARTSTVTTSDTQWVGWVTSHAGTWEASGIVEGYQPDEALANDLGVFVDGAAPTKALKEGASYRTTSGSAVVWRDGAWQVVERGVNRKIAILGNSITAQSKPFCSYDSVWADGVAITLNAYRNPVMVDLSSGYSVLRYKCTTAGTTGSTEPVWPVAAGATVTDGTAVWTAELPSLTPFWGVGAWSVANALMGQPFDEVAIVGASSRESPFILSYLDRVLALNPGVVFFANVWENDVGLQTATIAQIEDRWDAYVSAVRSAKAHGCTVAVQTCLPSGYIDSNGTVFTGYVSGLYTKAWSWINQQIRSLAKSDSSIILVDVAAIYADPNPANPVWPDNATTYGSPTGTGQQLKATDGVHPYSVANYSIAKVIASAMLSAFPAISRFQPSLQVNQIFANPLNYGSSGTLGTNTTGAVPNSITVNTTGTGSAGVASAVSKAGSSGKWCRVAASVASGVGKIEFRNSSSISASALVTEGKVWQAFIEMRLHTIANLYAVGLQLSFGGSPAFASTSSFVGATTDQYVDSQVAADTEIVLKTVPVKIPTGAANIQWSASANYYGAVSNTVDFGSLAISRTEIPALA